MLAAFGMLALSLKTQCKTRFTLTISVSLFTVLWTVPMIIFSFFADS